MALRRSCPHGGRRTSTSSASIPPSSPQILLLLLALISSHPAVLVRSFEFPKLPSFFGGAARAGPSSSVLSPPAANAALIARTKSDLLTAVSGTENGKTASTETQVRVLRLVRTLEKAAPPSDALLSDPNEAAKLDGTWYLQYTSPSAVEGLGGADGGSEDDDGDEADDAELWKPVDVSEGGAVEVAQFRAQGTIRAAGVTVDTAGRVTKQSFDISEGTVTNQVEQDFGTVTVKGPFRASKTVSNRAVVGFKELTIDLNVGPTLELGWIFSILEKATGRDVGGWLETTYLDEEMRIGRGNKGTMFVITRDPNAVRP